MTQRFDTLQSSVFIRSDRCEDRIPISNDYPPGEDTLGHDYVEYILVKPK